MYEGITGFSPRPPAVPPAAVITSENSAADSMTACDVCALGTAVVFCAADRANLCVKCDQEIHEANAMSARHIRVPLPVRFSSAPRDPFLIVPESNRCVSLYINEGGYILGNSSLRSVSGETPKCPVATFSASREPVRRGSKLFLAIHTSCCTNRVHAAKVSAIKPPLRSRSSRRSPWHLQRRSAAYLYL